MVTDSRACASLYFHIPFCTKKCPYCHFFVIPDEQRFQDQFMSALLKEWQQKRILLAERKLVSIYMGGGTPSLLAIPYLEQLLGTIYNDLNLPPGTIETTIEINPEQISPSQLATYARLGINRVSFGVQSFSPRLLKILERQHTTQQALDAIAMAREAGISNISIDLMFDLPDQTRKDWEETLYTAASLPIQHISLYNLTVEPHTSYYKKRNSLKKRMPDEETSSCMYQQARDLLTTSGFEQYEISAFCKNNAFSLHNIGYWTAREFLGLGPSAFSYWNKSRFQNWPHLGKYCRAFKEHSNPIGFTETLPQEAHQRELLLIALRMLQGVNLTVFENTHGPLSKDIYDEIHLLEKKGLLKRHHNTISMTTHAIPLYDTIAESLVNSGT